MIFSREFATDCRQLLNAISAPTPIALSRFCDGEYAILKGVEHVRTADGWTPPGISSDFSIMLYASLVYKEDGYHVGMPPPCCMKEEFRYLTAMCGTPTERTTFANVFVDGNHAQVIQWVKDKPILENCAIIASSDLANYKIPKNAVNEEWDLDGLINDLMQETRPILVAAGPAANIIVHRYWMQQAPDKRVTILDIGSVFDYWLHGHATRGYHHGDHPNRSKVCSWTKSKHS